MWKKIQPALPHAGILLANVLFVLDVIDQINPSMNFIDNYLSKGLLIAMSAVTFANWRGEVAREKRLRAKSKKPRKSGLACALCAVAAALCGVGLVIWLLDLIFPAWSLFLTEWLHLFLYGLCVVVIAACGLVASGNRKRLRRRLRKQKQRQKG